MRTSFRKGAGMVGAASLAMLLSIGLLAPANAQSTTTTFSGNASSYGVRVIFDFSGLPQSVKDQVNTNYATAYNALTADAKKLAPATFPFVIDQYFLKSSSEASNTVTKAVSVLTDGPTFPATGDQTLTADAVGQDKSKDTSAFTILKSADIGVLATAPTTADATIAALRATVASGPKVDSNNHLGKVSATLKGMATLMPAELKTVYTGAISTLNAQLDDTTNTLNTTIATAAQAGTAAAAPPGSPLAALLTTAGVDLNAVAASLSLPAINVIDPFAVDGLADITAVTSKATSQRAGDVTSSDASSSLSSVNVLGGLFQSGLVNLTSHSETSGAAGSSKNSNTCSVANLRLGGADGASFDGKTVYVNGISIPVPPAQVEGVRTQVDTVFNRMGGSFSLCGTPKVVASTDGTAASQTVAAFEVVINPKVPNPTELGLVGTPARDAFDTALAQLQNSGVPLTPGAPLGVKITIDPSVSTSVTTVSPAAVAPVTAPAQLPRTGAPAILSVLSGLSLVGAGLSLRRKFR